MQNPLRAAHFPKDVDVDRAFAASDFESALHLFDRAVDSIGDQFFMTIATGTTVVDLGNDIAHAVIAVGIDGRHGADAARSGPCTGTGVIGDGHALPALDQRPYFTTTIDDGLQTLEQPNLPRNSCWVTRRLSAAL